MYVTDLLHECVLARDPHCVGVMFVYRVLMVFATLLYAEFCEGCVMAVFIEEIDDPFGGICRLETGAYQR